MGVRIQELPETTGINKEDVLIVEDGQGTKKGTVKQLDEALGVSQLKEDLDYLNENVYGKYTYSDIPTGLQYTEIETPVDGSYDDYNGFNFTVIVKGVIDFANVTFLDVDNNALYSKNISEDTVLQAKIYKQAVKMKTVSNTSKISVTLIYGADIENINKEISNLKEETSNITSEKIVNGAITTDKIAQNAVTTEKIASGAITPDKISALSIDNDKIKNNTITASKLIDGEVIKNKPNITITDANNVIYNTIFYVGKNAENMPTTKSGILLSYAPSTAVLQQIFTTDDGDMFIRNRYGTDYWSKWREIQDSDKVEEKVNILNQSINNINLFSMYQTFGAIGDSLSSGECVSNNGGVTKYNDLYEFSWGQFIAKDLGNKCINFSAGGLSTRSWLGSTVGLQKMLKAENLCQCYIIGLGVNDYGELGETYLGTQSDIGDSKDTCADTYYGNYAKIIYNIREIQPKADIFVLTMPGVNDLGKSFNNAIRYISENFNLHLIDLENDTFYSSQLLGQFYRQGHYSAFGYRLIANHMKELLRDYMIQNADKFKQIEFIGSDLSWS